MKGNNLPTRHKTERLPPKSTREQAQASRVLQLPQMGHYREECRAKGGEKDHKPRNPRNPGPSIQPRETSITCAVTYCTVLVQVSWAQMGIVRRPIDRELRDFYLDFYVGFYADAERDPPTKGVIERWKYMCVDGEASFFDHHLRLLIFFCTCTTRQHPRLRKTRPLRLSGKRRKKHLLCHINAAVSH